MCNSTTSDDETSKLVSRYQRWMARSKTDEDSHTPAPRTSRFEKSNYPEQNGAERYRDLSWSFCQITSVY